MQQWQQHIQLFLKMKKSKPNILAIIPARSGSKGLKNKNIKKIKNKSLIQYAIDAAISTNIFSHILLTSDSIKYKKEITHYNNKVDFILRDRKLSFDTSNTLDTWRDSVRKSEKKYNKIFKYSFLLEPTNPLRNVSDLKKLYKKINNSKYDGVLTISQTPETFTKEKTLVIKKKNYLITLLVELNIQLDNISQNNFIEMVSVMLQKEIIYLNVKMIS